jgi:hypothetical protein
MVPNLILSQVVVVSLLLTAVAVNAGAQVGSTTRLSPFRDNSSEPQTPSNDPGFFSNFKKNFQILLHGPQNTISDMKSSWNIHKKKEKGGLSALTYTDMRSLSRTKSDVLKCLRLFVSIPMAPELFMYTKVMFPLLSTHNPWAWKAFPSSFDSPENAAKREKALVKRQMQTTVYGLHELQGQSIDDTGSLDKIESMRMKLQRIERALTHSRLDSSLQELRPWLLSTSASQATRLDLKSVPGSIVQQCCRALGEDVVPNVPLLRKINTMRLNGKLSSVRESDDFLLIKGIDALSSEEVGSFEL